MAIRYKIVDGFKPSMLIDITKKIQKKYGISSRKYLLALQRKNVSYDNMEVIMKIGIGCTRIMDMDASLDDKSVIMCAKRILNPTKKSLEKSAINEKLIEMNYGEIPFRPWHIRNALHQKGVTVSQETLSKVLKAKIVNNILSKTSVFSRKRGRPSEGILTGPNSYYESSRYMQDVRRVLSIPEAVNLIISLLLESGCLTRYVYHLVLVGEHIKAINEQEKWKKSTMVVTTIGRDFPDELLFDPRKDFDEARIRCEAVALTEKSLEKVIQNSSIIMDIITTGGVGFYQLGNNAYNSLN